MNSGKIKPFILALSIFLCFQAAAQRNVGLKNRSILNNERLSLTAGLGLSSYYGDLCDKYECLQFRPNLGIGAMLRMTNNIGIKADLNYFRLYSDDVWERRNLDFRSNNVELIVAGYIQLNPYERYAHKRKPWNIYAYAGVGLLYFRPEGSLNGKWHALRRLETEGVSYSPFTAVIPYGAAFSYTLNKNYDIMLEFGYRKTFTDRLDDVSSKEWRMLEDFDNRTAAEVSNKTGRGNAYWLESGQYRGNPDRKDGYFMSQVKIRYTFISKKSYYKLRRAPMRKRF